jgi:hypothetical protein
MTRIKEKTSSPEAAAKKLPNLRMIYLLLLSVSFTGPAW